MNHDLLSPGTGERQLNNLEAEVHGDLVQRYQAFKDHMHPKADVIYHPCSSNDVSPSEVFPDSRVIYADINEEAMEALRRGGYEAHTADIYEFDPGEVDILFLLNPAVSPEVPSSHVVGGGFAVANDYHGTADWLHASGEYDVRAIIKKRGDEILFDDAAPEDYWKEVATEEEFQHASGSMNAVNYARAAQAVEAMTGRTENVLTEYKELMRQAQQQDLELRRAVWAHAPTQEELSLFGGTPEDTVQASDQPEPQIDLAGPWQIVSPTGEAIILTPLPRRNGSEDDLFVFQKRSTSGQ